MFKGEAEMRALSVAGMDGAVLGNHEFDLGAKNLFDKIDNWATYPLLAGNYAWDDPPHRRRTPMAGRCAMSSRRTRSMTSRA